MKKYLKLSRTFRLQILQEGSQAKRRRIKTSDGLPGSETVADAPEVVGKDSGATLPTMPLPKKSKEESQDVSERARNAMDYRTQYGQADVEGWGDDVADEIEKTTFKEAQKRLQPAPQKRDEHDLEYDFGKKKHKPKKQKDLFEGKSAFDLEQKRREQNKAGGGGKGRSKGKAKGKGKGKGKGKSKGKDKGKGKGKGGGKFKG
eukprot:TRINITY_DN9870_c3_g1_i1.p1 TRINITY_DN9870_c3_g1~~TRINITY_DN9870_c3_g1_i1.p1  ORF type:complete len:203 (-),score=63.39 TRINITY_DN9870_c3_g1_i1:108-716(-)